MPTSSDPPPRRSLRRSAGIGQGPDEQRASDFFVDRVGQSEAFSESVLALHRRLRESEPDVGQRDNVLVYYGHGGIGKTSLSQRLEKWINGHVDDPEWGPPPHLADRKVVTARWDLTDRNGSLVPITLLRGIRTALHGAKSSWPGFDLAFSLFHRKVENTELLSYGRGLDATSILESALSDLADAFDLFGTAGIATASTSLINTLVRRTRNKIRTNAAIARHENYLELLAACDGDAGAAHQPRELIEALTFTLTEEIDSLSPEERPLLIVFVDPFEKVQGRGAGSGEDLVCLLAKALPLCLFAITGRNKLTWNQQECGQLWGYHPTVWVSLSATVGHEPRQHMVGYLSDKDSTAIFTHFRRSEKLPFTDSLIREMVESVKGLPIHIDALASTARERVQAGDRNLSLDKLGRNLPDVLNRLLDDLPDSQARAFRAACLTSSFDSDLVSQVANVDEADVLRLCRRAIVEKSSDALAPYRIHDALRDIMVWPGADATYSWTPNDWKRAAERGISVALARFEESHTFADSADTGAIRSMTRNLALAINLCIRWSVYDDRIRECIKRGPSLENVYPLLDSPPSKFTNPHVGDLYDYIRARTAVSFSEAESIFARLYSSASPFGPDAGLWIAYRMRIQGRIEEALEIFAGLRKRGTGPQNLYLHQYITTLVFGRRFLDAENELNVNPPKHPEVISSLIRKDCGLIDAGTIAMYDGRISRATSNRFRTELVTFRAITAAQLGLLSREEAIEVRDLATISGAPGHEIQALTALGLTYALSEPVNDILAEIDYLTDKAHDYTGRLQDFGASLILAVRMLARKDLADVDTIKQRVPSGPYRSRTWIPVEIVMEELGHPLPPVDAQWPMEYDRIRSNWLGICRAMAARISD